MINEPPPFKDLDIRIPVIIPIQGRGFMNQGSTLRIQGLGFIPLGCLQLQAFGMMKCGLGIGTCYLGQTAAYRCSRGE